jgi:hypothetical protein
VAVEQVAEGVELADAPFGGGGQVGLGDGEVGESFEVRQQPPELRCCTLTGRMVLSAWLLVKMSRSGRVAKRRIMSSKFRNRRASPAVAVRRYRFAASPAAASTR